MIYLWAGIYSGAPKIPVFGGAQDSSFVIPCPEIKAGIGLHVGVSFDGGRLSVVYNEDNEIFTLADSIV